MLKNIITIINFKNIQIILLIFSVLLINFSCSNSKNITKWPDNIAPTELYNLPIDLDRATLIPDRYATDTLRKYETENWLRNPWVYKMEKGSAFSEFKDKFEDNIYSIDTKNTEKILVSFRNMKVAVPYYRLNYRCNEGGWFRDPACFMSGRLYLDQDPNTIIVKSFWKRGSGPLSHEAALKELDLEKYKKCVFILGGRDEHKMNYGNNFDGIKLICINNDKERDEIIKALIGLEVRY
jgi:hypothetical protein